MSETWQDQGPGAAAATDGASAGTLLRRAREAAGLHVAALAVSLKVPVRKLEALEDDRWDLLTDSVFVRALASSVCRTLKIDPQPVLERLPQNAAPKLLRDDGINTPFRSPSDGAPPNWFDNLTRPVFLAVFALLLGALVLIFLPTTPFENGLGGTKTSEVVAPAQPGTALPAAPTLVTEVPAPPPVATAAAAVPPAPPVAAAATMPSASASAAPAEVAPSSATGIVVIRAKGPSWVEVTDAKGVVSVRKVLEAGEAAGASGALPLHVTIGRVDHAEVQVRGKPFDLQRVSKDNVARFDVK